MRENGLRFEALGLVFHRCLFPTRFHSAFFNTWRFPVTAPTFPTSQLGDIPSPLGLRFFICKARSLHRLVPRSPQLHGMALGPQIPNPLRPQLSNNGVVCFPAVSQAPQSLLLSHSPIPGSQSIMLLGLTGPQGRLGDPPAFLFLKILTEMAQNQAKCKLNNFKVWGSR